MAIYGRQYMWSEIFASAPARVNLTDLQELQHGWSIKNWVERSISVKLEKESLSLSTDPIEHNVQYFVFFSNQKVRDLYNIDNKTLKKQMKFQSVRSMKDVYKKLLHSNA